MTCFPPGKVVAPATKGGMHFLARRAVVWFSDGRKPGCPVFAAKGGIKNAPERAPTSPAGTVSQPIGKPFNGQAKGLLWLTWRSYAGPPQYFIPPEGGALNPSGRRQPIPDRTLGAQGRQARRRHQPSPAGRQPSGIPVSAESSQRPMTSNDTHSKKALTITVSAFQLISSFLSSRAASSQVLSAFVSLTTVFGMGTGVSSQLSPLNL